MSKIGIGVITCNRESFYRECCKSIPQDIVDHMVTVNDGEPYKYQLPAVNTSKLMCVYQNETNLGVGKSKNKAIQHLLNCGCEHIFLIEDDIIIKDKNVFTKYIDTAKASGIWHLMYGYHGPANKTPDKKPNPRLIVDYKYHKVALNQHCVGAFCYYHKGVLKNAGLMDEEFKNAWEHVEHSYQIVKLGLLPGYWWWPDVANSYDYLDEQACSEDNSTIRWEDADNKIPKKDWQDNIQKGAMHFADKHGYSPVQVPDNNLDNIQANLKFIKDNYSKQ